MLHFFLGGDDVRVYFVAEHERVVSFVTAWAAGGVIWSLRGPFGCLRDLTLAYFDDICVALKGKLGLRLLLFAHSALGSSS